MTSARIYIVTFVFSWLLFLLFYPNSNFNNSVEASGDGIEYQSIAVNHFYGRGFMYDYARVEIHKYKFNDIKNSISPEQLKNFKVKRNLRRFLNAPLYPLFLSSTYKIFGVNPYYVKAIQLYFLCLAVSLLIPFGYLLKGWKGLIAGTLSGVVFLYGYQYLAAEIYVEPLMLLANMFLILSWFHYKNRRNNTSSILLGLLIGLGILIKGSTFFICFGFLVYESFSFIKSKDLKIIKQGLKVFLFSLLTLAPYLIWQNAYVPNDGTKTFVAKHGGYLLLSSNNEQSIDGNWHEENVAFDYTQSLDGYDTPLDKVIAYYKSNPQNIIPTFTNKLINAFLISQYTLITILSSLALSITLLVPLRFRQIASILALLATVVFTLFFNDYVLTFCQSHIELAIFLFTLSFISIWYLLNRYQTGVLGPFFMAPILITLAFYGNTRFVIPFLAIFSFFAVFNIFEMIQISIYKVNNKG